MTLMCGCDDFDADWFYEIADDGFSILQTKRRRRCCSCKKLIDIGTIVQRFFCYRFPQNDIEERIYGEEVPMADKFMCEECGDIFWSITDLGYCINLGSDVRDALFQYQEMTNGRENHIDSSR